MASVAQRQDGEHSGSGFVGISNIFVVQNDFFSEIIPISRVQQILIKPSFGKSSANCSQQRYPTNRVATARIEFNQ